MRNKLLVIFICFCAGNLCNRAMAQNLVLNPSFQNFSSCPTGISEFYLCTNWATATTTASDTCSTPDLYATCSQVIGGVNIPNCLLGYHTAYTGTGFAGQILGDGVPGCLQTGDNYREYIEGTLSTPLVAGNNYLVVVYMSLADASMWGSNSYGIYFTNTQYVYDACPNPLIGVTPQLEMCGPAIMDTVNWVPVQWIYTATGGEKYMTLGNFKDDANTNHVTHNCGSFNPYIYYYIGYVSLSPVGPNDCGVTLIMDSVNSTCGTSNGSVSVTASACTSPFTYVWSTTATTPQVQNVGPGTYTVTVTDASNCKETASISVNSKPLAVTTTGLNPACGTNTGIALVNVGNGTGPYTYHWSNSGSTDTISNLGAGTYYVTVTGAAGCLAHDSLALFSSSGLTLSPAATAASCGSNNGTATVGVTGGSSPYTFTWSNSQTTQTATNLAAGTYTVTVVGDTSGSGPFWSEDFTSGGTGWTLNTPGTGPDGNAANQWVINNDNTCVCGSGNYLHITTTTYSGCLICASMYPTCTYLALASLFMEGDFTTDVLAISPVISTLGKSNIVLTFNWECLGTPGSDYGLVDLSNDGGTTWTSLPFNYDDSSNCSLATIAIPISYQNSANFRIAFEWINAAGTFGGSEGNPPGFVIDNIALTAAASSCPATASVTVPSSGGLTLALTPTQPSCGLSNGSVTANVTAGTGPFTYVWNNNGSTQTISNVGAGTYIVTVSNGSGCSATSSVALSVGSGTISAISSATNATCGNSNGTAAVQATGGSGYTYLWSNNATTDSINGLTGGNYTVTVTATGGCTATASVSVSATNNLVLTPATTPATCGNTNGTATVTPGSPGTYTYAWSNSLSTQTISNLAAGNYTVTVTVSGNCSATASLTVAASGGLTITPTVNSTTCGNNNGSVSLSVTGGSGTYTYGWSNNASAHAISNLAAGSYTVTVNDGAGCSATASVTINPSGGNSVVVTPSTQTVCSGDTATVCAPTGYAAYAWNTGDTTACISTTFTGNYYVTATDNGGCTATSNHVTINNYTPTPVTVSVNGDTLTSYTAVSYQWYLNGQLIPGATSATYIAQSSGSYKVEVTDANGCHYSSSAVNVVTGINDVNAQADIKVYPNPLSSGNWHVDVSETLVGSTCEVFDADGRMVYKGQLRSTHSEIALNVAEGVYMLQVHSAQINYNIKLIKLY